MDTLEQLLTDHLALAAESADPRPPDRAEVIDAAARRRQRRRARRGLLVAAVALVAAGIVSVSVGDDRSRTDIADNPSTTVDDTTTTSSTTSSTSASTTVPTTVPGGQASPPPLPVIENLALRADGIGAIDFGTPMADAVAAVTAELGPPRVTSEPQPRACMLDPALTINQRAHWEGIILWFGGDAPESLRLVGWEVGEGADAAHRLRMADGPALSDPLPVWEGAYGDALAMEEQPAGDGATMVRIGLRLPVGMVEGYEWVDASGRSLHLWAGQSCDLGE